MRRRRQLRTQLKQSALQATGQVVRVSSNGVVQYQFAAGGRNVQRSKEICMVRHDPHRIRAIGTAWSGPRTELGASSAVVWEARLKA